MASRHAIVDLTAAELDTYAQGWACVDMLKLCGELGGMREDERPQDYLRRLIDVTRLYDREGG